MAPVSEELLFRGMIFNALTVLAQRKEAGSSLLLAVFGQHGIRRTQFPTHQP